MYLVSSWHVNNLAELAQIVTSNNAIVCVCWGGGGGGGGGGVQYNLCWCGEIKIVTVSLYVVSKLE